jgi:hypothetical protein
VPLSDLQFSGSTLHLVNNPANNWASVINGQDQAAPGGVMLPASGLPVQLSGGGPGVVTAQPQRHDNTRGK